MLVEPGWLLERLGDPNLVIVDARPAGAYAAGHIPGAVNANVYDYLVEDSRPEALGALTATMTELLAPLGLTGQEQVVWYDDTTGMRETRGLWFLHYLGYERTAVLHGGLRGWVAAGGALTREPGVREARVLPAAGIQPGVLATVDQVLAAIGDSSKVLLDTRTDIEYSGEDGHPCCERQGRLPGAVWVEWNRFLDGQGRFRAREELLSLLAEYGITPDKEIIPYCHRGARAANTYLALRVLGFPRVRNFIGSWHEWSLRAELPSESDFS